MLRRTATYPPTRVGATAKPKMSTRRLDCITPVGTGDGPADVDSNTVEGNLHANRAWTCSNEEGGTCLRLLDARGGAQPRLHLRSHRGRPLCAQRRDQIPQQG